MDLFTIFVVGMGTVVTVMLAWGVIAEYLLSKKAKS